MKREKMRRIQKARAKIANRYALWSQDNPSISEPFIKISEDGMICINFPPTVTAGFGRLRPKSKGQRKRRREATRVQQQFAIPKDTRRL